MTSPLSSGTGFDGAKTPEQYTVEPLEPDRLLVHGQPVAWLTSNHGPMPDEDRMTQAPADLADVLTTTDDL